MRASSSVRREDTEHAGSAASERVSETPTRKAKQTEPDRTVASNCTPRRCRHHINMFTLQARRGAADLVTGQGRTAKEAHTPKVNLSRLERSKILVLLLRAPHGRAKDIPGVGVHRIVAGNHAPRRRARPKHSEERELRRAWIVVLFGAEARQTLLRRRQSFMSRIAGPPLPNYRINGG